MNAFLDSVARMDRQILGGGPDAVSSKLGATTLTYASPTYGTVTDVPAVFDLHFVYQAEGGPGVERIGPAVWLRLEDLGPIDPMDANDKPRLSITEPLTGLVTDYKVHERHQDHFGGIQLFLRKVIP